MGVMSGPMLLQPLLGMLLDLNWQGALNENGMRIYDFQAYRIAFSLTLAWLCLTILTLFLSTKSHCTQQVFDETV